MAHRLPTNVIRAGQVHLEEVMDLVESGEASAEDLSVILAQVDLIYAQVARLKVSCRMPDWRILAHLCRPEGIRAMVEAGAHPRVVRAIRQRRARTFDLCLERLDGESRRRVALAISSACRSGEWLHCGLQGFRSMKVRYNVLLLQLARRLYLLGVTVDVRPTVERLRLLIEAT